MKKLTTLAIVLIVLFSALIAFAETNHKCPGEEGYIFTNYRHRNPTEGGFISNEAYINDTDAMIFIGPEVVICGSSDISDRAKIYGKAKINSATISGQAKVYGNAEIGRGAEISENAKVYGNAEVYGSVYVDGKAIIAGNAKVFNNSEDYLVSISERARVTGYAEISENAIIQGKARVQGHTRIFGDAIIEGSIRLEGYSKINEGTHDSGVHNPSQSREEKQALKTTEEKEKKQTYLSEIRDLTIDDFISFGGVKMGDSCEKIDAIEQKFGEVKTTYYSKDFEINVDNKYLTNGNIFGTIGCLERNDSEIVQISLYPRNNTGASIAGHYLDPDNKQLILLGGVLSPEELTKNINMRHVKSHFGYLLEHAPANLFFVKHYFISYDKRFALDIEQRTPYPYSINGILSVIRIIIRPADYNDLPKELKDAFKYKQPYINGSIH